MVHYWRRGDRPDGAVSRSWGARAGVWLGLAALAAVGTGCGTLEAHSKIVAAAGGAAPASGGAGPGTAGPLGPGGAGSPVQGGLPVAGGSGGQGAPGSSGVGSLVAGPAGASSGSATGPSPSGSPAGNGPTGTGGGPGGAGGDHSPIVIGSVGNYSGITGGAEAPGVVGLEAWVSYVNAHGGVNGHPIRLYVRDDQSDPGQNLADTQALVQQEHIVAEVSVWASQTQQASASYLEQQGIPVIGGDGTGEASWGQMPNFFPEGDIEKTLVEDGPAAGAKLLFPRGERNLAILVCQEGAICSEGASIDGAYAPSIGWHVVYNQSASFAAPSYAAQCLQMKSAHAQAVILIMPSSSTVNVANSCHQQGFDPAYLIGYGVTEGNFNTIPGLRNSIVFNTTFPFAGGGTTPAVAEYQQAMRQYEPNQILDPATSAGWASAQIFQAAIEKIGGPVTPAAITAALETFRDQTFGGLTIPLSFTRGPVNPPPCWFVMTIVDSRWTAPYGDTPQCAA